jgi:hypothetical protein
MEFAEESSVVNVCTWPIASVAAAQQLGGDLRHDRALRYLAPNVPRA